jgi:hypothetical protein
MSIVRRCVALLILAQVVCAQNQGQNQTQAQSNERALPFAADKVQAALKKLPGGTSGPLPLLDGFVVSESRSLDQYQRAFYQCNVRVITGPSDGSLVQVTAKISAWNNDPSHSRYEALKSNGRIEADLLDRLENYLRGQTAQKDTRPAKTAPSAGKAEPPPDISAPARQFPSIHDLSRADSRNMNASAASANPALEQEARGLEDVLRNQAHPTNLVAVTHDATPVLQAPRTDATVLFLASAQDEFEILNVNPDWVYVRISGLSRGWIRRSNLEMLDETQPPEVPEMHSASASPSSLAAPPAEGAPFTVENEVTGNFPGEWEPLKGKSVKIVSAQQSAEKHGATTSDEKLHFATSVFSAENKGPDPVQGLVVIFDTEDGGMVAATSASIQQWRTGAISEEVFWQHCYFDPPDVLGKN